MMNRLPTVPALLVVALLTLAGCGQEQLTPITQGESALSKFTVETPGLEFPVRTTLQLKAFGLTADGKKVDLSTKAQWVNLDSTIARVGPSGIVQLDGAGVARFEVRYEAFTVPVAIQVNAAQLTSLTLSAETDAPLALGDARRFTARAWFDDGSSLDVTDRATWATDGAGLSLAGLAGQVVGHAEGQGRVRATYFNQEATAALRIGAARFVGLSLPGPQASIKPGDTQQLSLYAVYSDGSRRDVSSASSWSTSDSNVLDVTLDGMARGIIFARGAGQALITARFEDHAAERLVLVSPREVLAVRFATPSVQLALGRTMGVDLLAELDDGSTVVVTSAARFTSSQPDVAEVSSEGVVTGVSMGATSITAEYAGKLARYDVLISAPELVTLTPTLSGGRLAVGQVADLVISGTFTDGATLDLTGAVQLSAGENVSAALAHGHLQVTGAQLGDARVDVELGAIATQLSFEVTDVAIASLELIDAAQRVPSGAAPVEPVYRLRAIAVYADGVRLDVSELCTWSVDDVSVVGLNNQAGQRGNYALAHGGTATVSATIANVEHRASWTFAANP